MIYRIARNDPNLKRILWTGQIYENDVPHAVLLKAEVKIDQAEVFFEKIETSSRPVSVCLKWFISLRAISLTATATPALVVLLSGTLIGGFKPRLTAFWLSFLSVLFLQIAVNVLNDVEDHLNLVDAPGDIGGSGVIQKGWISAQSLAKFGYTSLILGILAGVYPLFLCFRSIWPVVLLSLIGVVGYSGSPFRFKYRALGDSVVFLLCGPFLAFGFSVVSFGQFGFLGLLIGAVFGLAATGILHANNLNDLEVDASRGARTVANRLGFESSKRYLFFIYAMIPAALLLAAVTQDLPLWFCFTPFLTAPLVLPLLFRVKRASGPLSPSLSKIRFEASQIHLLIGLSWMIGFAVLAMVRAH